MPVGPTRLAASSWGLLMGGVSIAAVHGSFVFGFFFLSTGAGAWPPEGMGPPSALRGLATTGLVVLGAGLAALAWRLTAAGSLAGVRSAHVGAALAGGAAAVLTSLDVASQIPEAVEHAYPGTVALLHGVVAAAFGAAVVIAAVLAVTRRVRREDSAVLAGWWLLIAVLWLPTYAAVQIWSRVQ